MFSVALDALKEGYGYDVAYIGCDGTIGCVGRTSEILARRRCCWGSAAAMLSHDEYLHLEDWCKLQKSLFLLVMERLAKAK
jgi:hypothetical protein